MAQSFQHRLRHQISKILDFLGIDDVTREKRNAEEAPEEAAKEEGEDYDAEDDDEEEAGDYEYDEADEYDADEENNDAEYDEADEYDAGEENNDADYSDDDDVTENADEYQPCDGDPSEHPTTT